MRGEFEWIEEVRKRVPPADGVRVGIGDDAAVLETPPGQEMLFTTDLLVEGIHFRRDVPKPEDVGWKALAVSISDIAAMGGRSAYAVVSVALRGEQTGEFADRLLAGMLECASRYGVALVGGDTTATPGPVILNVALTGFAERGRAVLRSGARPGEAVCVTGAFGGSILGRHLRATPRQVEALALVQEGPVSAMIDVSDGLSSDLGHLVDASGVGAEIWEDRIPVHPDAVALSLRDAKSALSHALDDGEDFELCFTTDEARARRLEAEGLAGTRVHRIGRIMPGSSILLRPREGADSMRPVARGGHDHFRRA